VAPTSTVREKRVASDGCRRISSGVLIDADQRADLVRSFHEISFENRVLKCVASRLDDR
jgi:hypothetical protein